MLVSKDAECPGTSKNQKWQIGFSGKNKLVFQDVNETRFFKTRERILLMFIS